MTEKTIPQGASQEGVRVYLAGPMRGIAEHNYPTFHRAAAELRAQGLVVVNPAEINADWASYDEASRYRVCLSRDIIQLLKCNGIYLLPGWEASTGARIEHAIASAFDMSITYLPGASQEAAAEVDARSLVDEDEGAEWLGDDTDWFQPLITAAMCFEDGNDPRLGLWIKFGWECGKLGYQRGLAAPQTVAGPATQPAPQAAAEPADGGELSDEALEEVALATGFLVNGRVIGPKWIIAARAAIEADRRLRTQTVAEHEHHGLDTADRVCFYEQDFYVLSNFSSFNLRWRGHTFPTSEHAYHWEKFHDQPDAWNAAGSIAEQVRRAPSAHEAFKVAEGCKPHRRADWDEVKVGIMRDILRAKAAQHEYVRRKLLATGDRELVENSWRDDFWGWGPNRDGQNMLGELWMQVRAELRATAEPGEPT